MNGRFSFDSVLTILAQERRRVVSAWRLLIVCRRICLAQGLPLMEAGKARRIERRLLAKGQLLEVGGIGGVYLVSIPYADVLPYSDELVVQEANPWGTFSHHSAIVMHGLTDETPARLYATQFAELTSSRLPLGTTPEDWIGVRRPPVRRPKRIGETGIEWTSATKDFGCEVGFSQGQPIYVTDRERTLFDSLRSPQKCGGILSVVQVWRRARNEIQLPRLTAYVEHNGSPVMRQRIGYFLESLGLHHPRLDTWKADLRRGGSMKLVADAPFSPLYSANWNLSLNVPESVIEQLRS